MKNLAKADLHIHSKFSAQATHWLARRLAFPASCSEPTLLYQTLREKSGMDFVTLTDHNTLDGCLEIAHLPHVFLSEEITAHFPEDHCKVHLLVFGLTEQDHRDLHEVRFNIYELQALLTQKNLPHAVAHALENSDPKFTPQHFQKLILLFRHFETINGKYPKASSKSLEFVLRQLTPATIARFVETTGVDPTHPEPWKKAFLGGSNDYGGLFAGQTWTEIQNTTSMSEFLAELQTGNCTAHGHYGDPLRLAHGFFNTAFSFAKTKLNLPPKAPSTQSIEKGFRRFIEGNDPAEVSFSEKLQLVLQGITSGKILDLAKLGKSDLGKEIAAYFAQPARKAAIARITADVPEPERRAFLIADLMASQLAYRLINKFIQQITDGRFLESIQFLAPFAPVLAFLAPYLQSFKMTPRLRLAEFCAAITFEIPPCLKNEKRAWFTDTLDDVNGVSTTIQKMTSAGLGAGYEIIVVTSCSQVHAQGITIKNFPPIAEFVLPEYELQKIGYPPLLKILDWLVREEITEIIISTPGPVGCTALLAAKLLGLPSVSIYHTDFPQYVSILTDDPFMEMLTWKFMHWFYSQQEVVYVNSEDYRQSWLRRGLPAERLRILPRGLDTQLFHPSKKSPSFWQDRGLQPDETGVLFVGRISKEKNLAVLVATAKELKNKGAKVRFLLVGDGPYLKELRTLLPDAIFTGYLHGEALATAFASADIFAFPSTTDTFGNVIIEAQACGTPCIVSDVGGPRDLVENGVDGLITPALNAKALATAILQIAENPALKKSMSAASRRKVQDRDWNKAVAAFWQKSEIAPVLPKGS